MNYPERVLDSILLVVLLSVAFISVAAYARNTDVDNGGVEVVKAGGIVMYRFRDDSGKMIIQDTPPPHYFDDAAPVAADAPTAPVTKVVKKVPPPPPPEPLLSPLQKKLAWSVAALLAAGAAFVGLRPWLRRRLSESAVERAVRGSGYASFNDVKLGTGGQSYITIDKLVRTPAGILVLVVEKLNGDIRGESKADHWATGTNVIPNPLQRLHQAAGIVESLATDVPVYGRVVDLGNARFQTDMSPTIQKLSAFRGSLPGLSTEGPAPRALDAAWRTLMRFERSNNETPRALGGGAMAWLKRYQNECLAALLMTLSIFTVITTVYLQGL